MNRIKKLFGICEHEWEIVKGFDNFSYSCGMVDKVERVMIVRCFKCQKQKEERMSYMLIFPYTFDINNYGLHILHKKDLSRYKSLLPSFKCKLNKKYNLNLTINDL